MGMSAVNGARSASPIDPTAGKLDGSARIGGGTDGPKGHKGGKDKAGKGGPIKGGGGKEATMGADLLSSPELASMLRSLVGVLTQLIGMLQAQQGVGNLVPPTMPATGGGGLGDTLAFPASPATPTADQVVEKPQVKPTEKPASTRTKSS